jgi:hypothetical protein
MKSLTLCLRGASAGLPFRFDEETLKLGPEHHARDRQPFIILMMLTFQLLERL